MATQRLVSLQVRVASWPAAANHAGRYLSQAIPVAPVPTAAAAAAGRE